MHTAPYIIPPRGSACTDDYIILAGGGAKAGATTNYDRYVHSITLSPAPRFCGGTLALSSSTTPATVYSNKLPFQVSP